MFQSSYLNFVLLFLIDHLLIYFSPYSLPQYISCTYILTTLLDIEVYIYDLVKCVKKPHPNFIHKSCSQQDILPPRSSAQVDVVKELALVNSITNAVHLRLRLFIFSQQNTFYLITLASKALFLPFTNLPPPPPPHAPLSDTCSRTRTLMS